MCCVFTRVLCLCAALDWCSASRQERHPCRTVHISSYAMPLLRLRVNQCMLWFRYSRMFACAQCSRPDSRGASNLHHLIYLYCHGNDCTALADRLRNALRGSSTEEGAMMQNDRPATPIL